MEANIKMGIEYRDEADQSPKVFFKIGDDNITTTVAIPLTREELENKSYTTEAAMKTASIIKDAVENWLVWNIPTVKQ